MATTYFISGLNRNAYFMNNPIWVDISFISNNTKYILVKVSDAGNPTITASFNLYKNGNTVYFDLAEIVKGYINEPNHPKSQQNGSEINTNYIKLLIQFFEVNNDNEIIGTSINFTRDFIRGGVEGQQSNVGFNYPQNVSTENVYEIVSVLKDSDLLPVWQGYPLYKYALTNEGKIRMFSIIKSSEMERRKVLTCNPLYIRFLNSKGGYQYWLFEKWEMEKKASKTEKIERRERSGSTGHEVDYSLTVTGRIDRRYFRLMRALLESPEVYAFNLNNLALYEHGVDNLLRKGEWARIFNKGDSIKINNFEEMKDFSLGFDYVSTNKPTIKW